MMGTIKKESGDTMEPINHDKAACASSAFCPEFSYAMSIISGKWKLWILYILSENPSIRFNELQRRLKPITYKMLTMQLKELAEQGIVIRTEYPQIPPKVEYRLSSKGESLIPLLLQIAQWGAENMPKNHENL